MEKSLSIVLLEDFKMKNKIYLSIAIMVLLGVSLLVVQGDTTEAGFDSEAFTNEIGNLEGANMDFFASEDFDAEGDVNYEIDEETGSVTLSSISDKSGSVMIKGQEFDLSDEGKLIMDKKGNIKEGENIKAGKDRGELSIGENQNINNLPEDAKVSFSREEGTFSYTGPEGEDNLNIEGVDFDKEFNAGLVGEDGRLGTRYGNFDFSIKEGGGNVEIGEGKISLSKGSYSIKQGEWDFGELEATIEKIPSSGVSLFKGDNVKLSEEITGRGDLSFSGSLKPSAGGDNLIIPQGTEETRLSNGVRFYSGTSSKGETSLFFKEENYQGKGSSLFIGENTIKGHTISSPGKAATVVLEEGNDYYGGLMKTAEGEPKRWVAIGSESATGEGDFTLTGARTVGGEKRPPVLERSGDVSFENGNRRYQGAGNNIIERRITTSNADYNRKIGERKTTPTVMVTKRRNEPSITTAITEKGVYHGYYKEGHPIEEIKMDDIETINPQKIPGIPTTGDPRYPYKISVSDLSTEYENNYENYVEAIQHERNIQQRNIMEFKNELKDELGETEAEDLINELKSADSNTRVQNIVDSYYERTGNSLPSLEGTQSHDENLLKLEKSLNVLKERGTMSQADYEKITSLGVNERELINQKIEETGVSWEKAFNQVFIEGDKDIRIGPRVMYNKYDLGISRWVRTD